MILFGGESTHAVTCFGGTRKTGSFEKALSHWKVGLSQCLMNDMIKRLAFLQYIAQKVVHFVSGGISLHEILIRIIVFYESSSAGAWVTRCG